MYEQLAKVVAVNTVPLPPPDETDDPDNEVDGVTIDDPPELLPPDEGGTTDVLTPPVFVPESVGTDSAVISSPVFVPESVGTDSAVLTPPVFVPESVGAAGCDALTPPVSVPERLKADSALAIFEFIANIARIITTTDDIFVFIFICLIKKYSNEISFLCQIYYHF